MVCDCCSNVLPHFACCTTLDRKPFPKLLWGTRGQRTGGRWADLGNVESRRSSIGGTDVKQRVTKRSNDNTTWHNMTAILEPPLVWWSTGSGNSSSTSFLSWSIQTKFVQVKVQNEGWVLPHKSNTIPSHQSCCCLLTCWRVCVLPQEQS